MHYRSKRLEAQRFYLELVRHLHHVLARNEEPSFMVERGSPQYYFAKHIRMRVPGRSSREIYIGAMGASPK